MFASKLEGILGIAAFFQETIMRFDTHRISVHVVQLLQHSTAVKAVSIDGGDIIQFDLHSGETVRIYLIENHLEVYEIEHMLSANRDEGIYSLFIVWGDLLLPSDGQRIHLTDELAALLALHNDTICAFDAFGAEVYLYPVHFEGAGMERIARFGETLVSAQFGCEEIFTHLNGLRGHWRVANFVSAAAYQQSAARTLLSVYYAALGVEAGANRAAVKRAYRRLARKFHPDVNTLPDAHERMQQINEAYDYLLRVLDEPNR
jgi:hypothetical protein